MCLQLLLPEVKPEKLCIKKKPNPLGCKRMCFYLREAIEKITDNTHKQGQP